MALFNRDKRSSADDTGSSPAEEAPVAGPELAQEAPEHTEDIPHVGISVSTYGAPAPRTPPAQTASPAPAEGSAQNALPENSILKAALSTLPEKPEPRDVMNVMRQALQGHLFVRVQGDARALLKEKKPLTLAATQINDKRFLLAFTGGAALQNAVKLDGDTQTSAVGQPALAVFRNVLGGPYAGLILDHASGPARVILPTQLIEKALDEGDEEMTIKNLLSRRRDDSTPAHVAEAIAEGKVFLALRGDGDKAGVTQVQNDKGERRIEVFSHPLELLALGRQDRAVPVTGAQLGGLLAADSELTGIVLDPGGPWMTLDRTELEPVLRLAPQGDDAS